MNLSDLLLLQKRQIVGLLEFACRRLELTDSQYKEAETRYMSVAQWLADSGNPILANANISPQGSMRLRTTVRPIARNEFDLDLVAHLPYVQPFAPVGSVHAIVGDRLRQNDKYKNMLEPMNRGWRLNYANEFHLDITPAIADRATGNGAVFVPDRKLREWKESNPKGYASWFDQIAYLRPVISSKFAEARASIEPLPEDEPFRGPLRRIVQVLKRHRDVHFEDKPATALDAAPISIVVTTLAAHAYEIIVGRPDLDNELDLLAITVGAMPNFITRLPGYGYWIRNPSNQKENFAEKWNAHPERAEAFYGWHSRVMADVQQLQQVRELNNQGLDNVGALLARMLGNRVSTEALTEYANRMNQRRTNSGLTVAPLAKALGITGAYARAAATRPNTFFGRE